MSLLRVGQFHRHLIAFMVRFVKTLPAFVIARTFQGNTGVDGVTMRLITKMAARQFSKMNAATS
jgi:hypothetical protein